MKHTVGAHTFTEQEMVLSSGEITLMDLLGFRRVLLTSTPSDQGSRDLPWRPELVWLVSLVPTLILKGCGPGVLLSLSGGRVWEECHTLLVGTEEAGI